jgi:hypothetical protein
METLACNLSIGRARRETLNRRQYLVAPMTMIRQGVLRGSSGPLFYPIDEMRKSVGAWNRTPIIVNHPPDGMSAQRSRILKQWGIGFVMRSRIANLDLKADGWFDIERTQRVEPSLYDCLINGRPFELSTGLYTRNIPAEPGASYGGRLYNYIATNYRPDHLAVLPRMTGACSLRDGCGVLVNRADPKPKTPGDDMSREDHGRMARHHQALATKHALAYVGIEPDEDVESDDEDNEG